MKRSIIVVVTLFAATGIYAQAAKPASPAGDDQKIVAVINGELVTKAKLDSLYRNLSARMRAQLDKSGGKLAFLDSYTDRRLLIQEVIKSGFDKKPDVQTWVEAAKDNALFDKYIRDTIVPTVITDSEVRKYYDEHQDQFVVPESRKVRHIVITWNNKPQPDAMDRIKRIATEIRAGAPSPRDESPSLKHILLDRFIDAAKRYSEDAARDSGGDLGWVTRGTLDKNFEEAAFAMPPMTMSGIVESQYGYHLIFVEDTRPARPQAFAEVKDDIREFLMSQHAADIMGAVKRLTNELRANSKISIYPENVN